MPTNNAEDLVLTDPRRKRLRFRAWHRGTKEMDLILGPFADHWLARMSDSELDAFEVLLTESDPDLYNWVTGREPIPADRDVRLLDRLIEFHNHR